jgi:hypothetical protein
MTDDNRKKDHEDHDLAVELNKEEKRNNEEERKAKDYLIKLVDNS